MNERKSGINWFDILSKVIFLIIIILVLLWFFPRNNNNVNSNDEINSKLDNIQTNISVLVDKIFRDNLNEMKSAARTYFTKDRMPSNDGESVKLSLQDMYDKNMILPLMDKDNKACNADESYVKVTKNGDKYSLKVSLTCGNQTKHITDTIGCYDFCKGDSCKNNPTGYVDKNGNPVSYVPKSEGRIQYQFVKETNTTKYSCPEGYVLKGKYCYTEKLGDRIEAEEIWSEEKTITKDAVDKGQTVYEEAIKTQDEPSYTCPAGYTLEGKVCTSTETIPATQGYEYTCPTGYTLNGNYCYKTTTISATPNYSYKCESGYTLNGTKCTKNTSVAATKTISYSCPSGYSRSGSKCTKTTTTKYKSGSKCVNYKTVSNGYTSWKYVKSYSTRSYSSPYTHSTSKLRYLGSYRAYSCSNHVKCPRKVTYYKYAYYTRSKKTKKVCSKYQAVYKTKTTKTTKNATATTSYTCPSGYTKNGTTCNKTLSIDASKYVSSYSCPDGYTKNGTICTLSDVTPATEVEGEYSCPDGYAISGNSCIKTTNVPATEVPGEIHYSCPEGRTLVGNQCAYKTTELTCADEGAVLDGDKCIVTIPAKVIGYKCPTGYIKDGNSCYKNVTVKQNAYTKTVVSYRYKWSFFKSLKGWKRTGKTRIV